MGSEGGLGLLERCIGAGQEKDTVVFCILLCLRVVSSSSD